MFMNLKHAIDNTCPSDFVKMSVLFIQKIILKGVSLISGKCSHAALICFYYFCILLVQSKENNIRTMLCNAMLSSYRASLT